MLPYSSRPNHSLKCELIYKISKILGKSLGSGDYALRSRFFRTSIAETQYDSLLVGGKPEFLAKRVPRHVDILICKNSGSTSPPISDVGFPQILGVNGQLLPWDYWSNQPKPCLGLRPVFSRSHSNQSTVRASVRENQVRYCSLFCKRRALPTSGTPFDSPCQDSRVPPTTRPTVCSHCDFMALFAFRSVL